MGLFSKGHNPKGGLFKRLFAPSAETKNVVIPEPVKEAPVAPSPPPPNPAPKATPKPHSPAPVETKSTTDSGGKRSAPRLRFSTKPDQVVTVRVDTRPTYDSSRLRASLSTLQGVVRGQALVASASYDEVLLSQTTEFVTDVVRLQHASYIALGHHQNIVALSNFFVEVVNMLEANGPRLEHEHASVLRRTRACLREACEVAESCNKPGWLVRMAKGEARTEEFTRLHSTALTLLRAGSLDTAPRASIDGKVRRLPEPNYPNLSKSIRQMLTTIGQGSMEAGVRRLRDDEEAQKHMAKMADVPVEAIQREANIETFFSGDATKIVENGAARDAEFTKVFSEYVTTSVDAITADGFEKLMTHMGLLDGMDTYEKPSAARAALVAADSDYDGALNFDEFRAFYSLHQVTAARLYLRMTASLELEYKVREVFMGFTNFGASKTAPRSGGNMTPRGKAGGAAGNEAEVGLECTRFAKLCRDCGLLSWGMTAPHVDVVYTASKPKGGARRLDFDHFLAALALVADRRGQSLDEVAKLVAEARGPAYRGTKTDFVSLHDDPSKFVGISARGGPHSGPIHLDLSALVARSKEPFGTLPPASGAKSTKIEPTKPQSPKLSTGRRTQGSGPCTPGRGVSLQAAEAKAAAKAASMASPKGPHAVFGRTCTARAAEMAASRKNKKNVSKAGPTATAVAKPVSVATAPQPVTVEPTYTTSRQLFAEPVVVQASPEPALNVADPPSPRHIPAAGSDDNEGAAAADDDEANIESASPITGIVDATPPVFEDPFQPDSSAAMVSVSSIAMKSLGSMASEAPEVDNQVPEAVEKPVAIISQVEQRHEELASLVDSSSLARSDSTAALAAMFAADPVDTLPNEVVHEAAVISTLAISVPVENEEEKHAAAVMETVDTTESDENIEFDEEIIA